MREDVTKQNNDQNDDPKVEEPEDGVDPKQWNANPRLASKQAAHMKELGPNYDEKKAARLRREKFQQDAVAKRRSANKAKRLEEEG